MQVYVINLKRRSDRLRKFKKDCEYKNVVVIEAFDGNNISKNIYNKNIYNKIKNHKFSKDITNSEIGCFVSHMSTWKKIINSNTKYNLIFEDDVIFSENFKKKLEKIDLYKYIDNILYVGGRHKPDFKMDKKYSINVTDKLVKHNLKPKFNWEQQFRGLFGYLITKRFAEILYYSFDFLYDGQAVDHYVFNCLKYYKIDIINTKPLLCYGIINVEDSDIRYKNGKRKRKLDLDLDLDLDIYQTSMKTNNKIKIINLERRKDRKNDMIKRLENLNIKEYEFINAVDSINLKNNIIIKKLFKLNRKVLIACALSHINIWLQLLKDRDNDYYIIMEDDVKLSQNFKNVIKNNKNLIKEKEFIYFGYSTYDKDKKKIQKRNTEKKFIKFQKDIYVGGYFTYSINKLGSYKLLKYLINNPTNRAIDFLNIQANLNSYEYYEHISTTDWDQFEEIRIDSDIQYNYSTI